MPRQPSQGIRRWMPLKNDRAMSPDRSTSDKDCPTHCRIRRIRLRGSANRVGTALTRRHLLSIPSTGAVVIAAVPNHAVDPDPARISGRRDAAAAGRQQRKAGCGFRRLLTRRDATAAVELALITPLMLTLFAGIIDFARVYDQEIELSSAVAAAAEYALINAANINSTNATSLAATLSGIVANTNGAAWAGATVTVNDGATSAVTNGTTSSSGTAANANSCWCPGGSSATWSWGAAATCGSACAGGTLAGKFVTVSGTRAFIAIFGNYGLISNMTLHQSTIVQA